MKRVRKYTVIGSIIIAMFMATAGRPLYSQDKNNDKNEPHIVRPADPFEEMFRIQREIERMFNSSYGRFMDDDYYKPMFKGRAVYSPDLDMHETEKEYIVKMDMPGMDKSAINIDLNDDVLTISGERKSEYEDTKPAGIHRIERSYGYFSRSITIPEKVKSDKIDATYKDGVLTVTIPKLQPSSPQKSVKIKVN